MISVNCSGDISWHSVIHLHTRPGWVEIKPFMFNYKATIQVNADTYWLKPGRTDDWSVRETEQKDQIINYKQTKLNEHWILKDNQTSPNRLQTPIETKTVQMKIIPIKKVHYPVQWFTTRGPQKKSLQQG